MFVKTAVLACSCFTEKNEWRGTLCSRWQRCCLDVLNLFTKILELMTSGGWDPSNTALWPVMWGRVVQMATPKTNKKQNKNSYTSITMKAQNMVDRIMLRQILQRFSADEWLIKQYLFYVDILLSLLWSFDPFYMNVGRWWGKTVGSIQNKLAFF